MPAIMGPDELMDALALAERVVREASSPTRGYHLGSEPNTLARALLAAAPARMLTEEQLRLRDGRCPDCGDLHRACAREG